MKTIVNLLIPLYTLYINILSYLQSVVLLGIRLYWGWQFCSTGWGKLNNLGKITEYFTSLHIPQPHLNAIMAGSVECFGGMLFLLGLGSRFVSIPLIFTMCVAYFTADYEALTNVWSDPDKFVSAAPFEFLLAALIVLVFGPGCFSADHWIGVFVKKWAANPVHK